MSGQRIAGDQRTEPALPSWIHELPPASREERVAWAWKVTRLLIAARAIVDYEWGDRPVPLTQVEWVELLGAVLALESSSTPGPSSDGPSGTAGRRPFAGRPDAGTSAVSKEKP